MKAALLILILLAPIFAQTSDRDRAVELYRQGNYASALVTLEKLSKGAGKTDGVVWNYIGLSYLKMNDLKAAEKALSKAVKFSSGDSTIRANYGFALLLRGQTGKARSAFTKAIELDPKNAAALFMRGTGRYWDSKLDDALADAEAALASDPDFAPAYALKADILVAKFGKTLAAGTASVEEINLLQLAIDTLQKCVSTCSQKNYVEEQKSKLSGIGTLMKYFKTGTYVTPENETSADSTITPVKIISKSRPGYTNDARNNGVKGVIRILALFDINGKVTQAFVVKSLGHGLDEQALRAARGIQFEPAKRNGVPYAVMKMIEYSFDIY
jgi:TonB family protein